MVIVPRSRWKKYFTTFSEHRKYHNEFNGFNEQIGHDSFNIGRSIIDFIFRSFMSPVLYSTGCGYYLYLFNFQFDVRFYYNFNECLTNIYLRARSFFFCSSAIFTIKDRSKTIFGEKEKKRIKRFICSVFWIR